VPASRLGWRITPLFATTFLGRIFDTPSSVFAEDMLRPELQSMPDFVDGVFNIAEAQAKSAAAYLEDGSVEAAIPPLKAVLHVMAEGHYEGKSIHDPEVRALFDREGVLASSWYRSRLEAYREREAEYIGASVDRLRRYLAESAEAGSVSARRARTELARTEERKSALAQGGYIDMIVGSIGLDPLFRGRK
jgi:phosphoenolpyruvate carboxykinase (diphosphate)